MIKVPSLIKDCDNVSKSSSTVSLAFAVPLEVALTISLTMSSYSLLKSLSNMSIKPILFLRKASLASSAVFTVASSI